MQTLGRKKDGEKRVCGGFWLISDSPYTVAHSERAENCAGILLLIYLVNRSSAFLPPCKLMTVLSDPFLCMSHNMYDVIGCASHTEHLEDSSGYTSI
jgi:hypothetical protein